jgi:hypothetical protein
MILSVFDDITRTNARAARHDEGRFEFLNRTASQYFAICRELIDEWFSHVPTQHQAGLRGNLRSELHHRSAFWELYLHEAYLRSGYTVEIHPDVPNRSGHPDFLLSREDQRFYLEAVTVGRSPAERAEEARLAQVHRLLADMLIEDFSIQLSTFAVGPRALATKALRSRLKDWLATLDADAVTAAVGVPNGNGFEGLPQFGWADDGWSLVFHAFPLGEWARGRPRSALGAVGPGEATIVDNLTGLKRVLESKRGKYGPLEAPLVVAVQSNTEYPTHDYEVEQALFGIGSLRPQKLAAGEGHLLDEGLWVGRNGWRSAEIPQVISIYDLAPWSVHLRQPRCWSTLETGIDLPVQPGWLAPMIIGDHAMPGPSDPMSLHFGLPADWSMSGHPDFDLS